MIGPVALAATWTLDCGATVFVLALNAVWSDNSNLSPTVEMRLEVTSRNTCGAQIKSGLPPTGDLIATC
jgi:hypothetical protein